MEIIVARNSGFCFGVKRAVNLAFNAVRKHKKDIYSLGPIIHNPQVVDALAREGVGQVDSIDKVKEGSLILRSHGITSPEILDDARSRGLNIIDATCPFVKKAQQYARRLVEEGYQVILVGDEQHPEVKSIIGHAGGDCIVGEDYDSIRDRIKSKKIGILTQTTQNYSKFSDIVVKCLKDAEELKIFNTICDATGLRQEEALELARKVDLMIVIGGRNSANTTRLAKICRETGKDVRLIETEDEIDDSWFKNIGRVGVTAGASTPIWLIEGVVDRLKIIKNQEV
jgi:4-hydroxy-3-methylbut-2-enyl diphosphate reductase